MAAKASPAAAPVAPPATPPAAAAPEAATQSEAGADAAEATPVPELSPAERVAAAKTREAEIAAAAIAKFKGLTVAPIKLDAWQ
jgi:hypothetical protein